MVFDYEKWPALYGHGRGLLAALTAQDEAAFAQSVVCPTCSLRLFFEQADTHACPNGMRGRTAARTKECSAPRCVP
jgi:hypothetical protein